MNKTQKCVYLKTFEVKRKEYKYKTLKSPKLGKQWSSSNFVHSLIQGSSGNNGMTNDETDKRTRQISSHVSFSCNQLTRKWSHKIVISNH